MSNPNKQHPAILKLTNQIDALYAELNNQYKVLNNTLSRPKRLEVRSEIRYTRMDLRIAKSARRATYTILNNK